MPNKLDELRRNGWSYRTYAASAGAEDTAYILEDEAGNVLYGALTDTEVVLDATPNDIRLGVTAVTDNGITVGEKDIPKYHTSEGSRLIPAGSDYTIVLYDTDKAAYTKLQALVCNYNTSMMDSVATIMVSINGKVYAVQSTDELATVTSDVDKGHIRLNLTNDKDAPCLIRYFTYKED